MENKTDYQLVKDFLSGDMDAFTELYNRHKSLVEHTIRKISGKVDVDDVSQEVWLLVFRKAKQFKGIAKFTTWLGRVVINSVFMELRKQLYTDKQTVYNTMSFENLAPDFDDENHIDYIWELGVKPTVENEVIAKDFIDKASNLLYPSMKEYFKLRAQGYEYQEMANIRGMSLGTAKSQTSKAVARVRKHMVKKAGV